MYAVRNPGPIVELGFNQSHDTRFDTITRCVTVYDVALGSPAEQAGLREGDRIIEIDGRELNAQLAYNESYLRGRPGDPVTLTVERQGEGKPLVLHGVFRAREKGPYIAAHESFARFSALQVIGLFPIPFLLVGFVVLFLRLEEPTAWLLALLCCAFICAPDLTMPPGVSSALRTFILAFRTLFMGMLGPVFYLFFSEFPVKSPLGRRVPWLKWMGLAFSAAIILPGLRMGHPSLPNFVARWTNSTNADLSISVVVYSLFGLGVFSLAQNAFVKSVPQEARRKSRVILFGTVAGVLPIVIERVAVDFAGYHPPFWTDTVLVAILSVYPLSFAYAVVKHRVMEIPALLRRSARYVLVQRGYFVLLFVAAAELHIQKHVLRKLLRLVGLNNGVDKERILELGNVAGTFSFDGQKAGGERFVPLDGESSHVAKNKVKLLDGDIAGKRHGVEAGAANCGVGKQTFNGDTTLAPALC